MTVRKNVFYFYLFFLLTLSSTVVAAGKLTEQAQRGQHIFQFGSSLSGEDIRAGISGGEHTVNAALVPCANCHGIDGKGKSEGGVDAPNITWDALTRPYKIATGDDEGRPVYDERLLIRAISLGFDSGGKELESTMPRFIMTRADSADLVAYLKELGTTEEPGVADSELILAVLLPPIGVSDDLGRAVREILTAFFGELNGNGGIYGRKLNLEFVQLPEDPAKTISFLSEFLDNTKPLAFVASFLSGQEKTIANFLSQKSIPGVGAFTLAPPISRYPVGSQFFVFPGIANEGEALSTMYVLDRNPDSRATVIYADHGIWRTLSDTIVRQLQTHGEDLVDRIPLPADEIPEYESLAQDIAASGVTSIFLLTPGQPGQRLVQAISTIDWQPDFFSPGLLAGNVFANSPPGDGSSLFLSYSTLAMDQDSGASAHFSQLASGSDAGLEYYRLEQMHAVAAAKILTEGLRSAGRDVSRQKLIRSLEELRDYQTGLTPDISYDANRRIGSGGVYVVEYDVTTRREVQRRWIKLK